MKPLAKASRLVNVTTGKGGFVAMLDVLKFVFSSKLHAMATKITVGIDGVSAFV